ncbi:hypothetical protein BaRGS_00001508 [Batillaria attramentaria]|uniref:Uncharacterized protein n=1 Tax=Batillaria attramentaria TaxID=370345 RepID=A0ABD0M8K0_9CAEN
MPVATDHLDLSCYFPYRMTPDLSFLTPILRRIPICLFNIATRLSRRAMKTPLSLAEPCLLSPRYLTTLSRIEYGIWHIINNIMQLVFWGVKRTMPDRVTGLGEKGPWLFCLFHSPLYMCGVESF